MIKYCATRPIEEYVGVDKHGSSHGVYLTYKSKPVLLAAVMLMSPLGFSYEGRCKLPGPLRPGKVVDDILLEESLGQQIGDSPLGHWLQALDPVSVCRKLLSNREDFSGLKAQEVYEDPNALELCVKARAVAWVIYYRGLLRRIGNIYKGKFSLNPMEDPLVTQDMVSAYEIVEKSMYSKVRGGGR